MKRVSTRLPSVFIVETAVHRDARGSFLETYHAARLRRIGLDQHFVQDAISRSRRGTVRGLHYQAPGAQGKLVGVLAGQIMDVVVDLRRSSPHFSHWTATELTAEDGRLIWIPPGFAHGFCVLSDEAIVSYKLTAYGLRNEQAVRWNDPDIGVEWPVREPILSARDATAPLLRDAPILPELEGATA